MSAPTTPPPAGWTVTGQTQGSELGDTGSFVAGFTVSFMTSKGNRGSVFVPNDLYSVDTVRQMVAAKAALMDSVHGMSG